MITSAGSPPSEIAAHVIQAIKENRMHILPNPEIRPVVEERFRRILAGENPLVIPNFEQH